MVIFLSACAACTQGPDYVRPSVEVPVDYRFDEGLNTTPDTATWWNAFDDEVLNGLIREAVAANRDLRVATARVDEFAAVLRGTQSQGRPQVGYGGNVSRERTIVEGTDIQSTASNFAAILSASWEIDLWGRIRRETEAARANLLATQEARRGVILTLVASVINSYVTLLDLDSRLQIAETTLAARAQSVSLYRARREGGTISDFEMAQILAEYESAVAAIPDLQQAIAQQENALSILLGRNPGPIARGRNLDTIHRPTVPASLPAELLIRRPDILQAEQQLIASNALIGAARALYFPRISLTALGGLASVALGNLFSGTARAWSFVGEVAGPIYTGGGIAAANQQAEARREQSLSAYERTIQNAFREVEDALVAVRTSREVEESYERRVAQLDRGVTLARLRYDNGYSDMLDVLDTERGLFSAQLSLAAAKADRYRALVSLYRALGGDWIDEADRLTAAAPAAAPDLVQQP
jgi:multidrug efflux system outer membrane protein